MTKHPTETMGESLTWFRGSDPSVSGHLVLCACEYVAEGSYRLVDRKEERDKKGPGDKTPLRICSLQEPTFP